MSIIGIVENDTIKLPIHVPNGTRVEITLATVPEPQPTAAEPAFLSAVLSLAEAQDWPADYALNHAHYSKGEPKR